MHHAPTSTGWIETICGSMFSGKTEELIRRLKRAIIARQRVQIFKPRIDRRYDDEAIASHSAQKLSGVAIDTAEDVMRLLDPDVEVVGIDEVQFLGSAIVDVCEKLAARGVRVICAGLDQDYRGKPFEPMPQLLAVSEFVSKELAICVACGNPANRTQRLAASSDQVLVGASESYEARCRKCFKPEPQPRTVVPEQARLPF